MKITKPNNKSSLTVHHPKKSPWDSLIKSLDQFSDDFMEDRNQPKQQKRVGLD